MIYRSFSEGAKTVETNCEDILAVKIRIGCEELYVVNVYDSSDESSFKKRTRNDTHETTLESLMGFLNRANLATVDKVILVGDFNSRTKNNNHIVRGDSDSIPFEPSGPVNDEVRASSDVVLNRRGELLLDFIACSNMTILKM